MPADKAPPDGDVLILALATLREQVEDDALYEQKARELINLWRDGGDVAAVSD